LPTLVPRNQRICFDVDGVIADDDGQPSYPGRRPFPQALCAMGLLKQLGNTIIIHTARYMRRFCGDQQRAHAAGYWELVRWLDQHHVPYDEIYLGKPSADLYIDDRGKQLDGHDDLAWAQLVGEE
jgi:capsule biosynthesis phosphatase